METSFLLNLLMGEGLVSFFPPCRWSCVISTKDDVRREEESRTEKAARWVGGSLKLLQALHGWAWPWLWQPGLC